MPILLDTVPRYNDRGSRRAVQNSLHTILQHKELSESTLKQLGTLLKFESLKPSIASTNAFVLLEWSTLALQEAVTEAEIFRNVAPDLATAAARSLEKCLDPSSRISLGKSALVIARRGIRNVLRSETCGDIALEVLIPKLTSSSMGKEVAPYLGVIAGVSARLPSRKASFAEHSKSYTEYYKREIIGSKTHVSAHLADGLHDFFAHFAESSRVVEDVLPAFEKAILRSPEIVLDGVIALLAGSLPSSIDVSEALSNHLAKPLISSLNSTNTTIKNGACSTFESLLARSHKSPALEKIADQILGALKGSKPANTDLRGLLARILKAFSPNVTLSTAIANGIGSIAI